MFWLGLIVGALVFGTAVWFGKEPMIIWYKGAEDYAGALNDKIKSLTGKN